MFITAIAGAMASTFLAEPPSTPPAEPHQHPSANLPCAPAPAHVRHMIFGTLNDVQTDIRHLHHLGYAEPNDWSRPLSTGRANEVMAILTKRVGAS